MNVTSRFAMPFILPGQAQKELFHNEALALLDAAVSPTVEGPPAAAPPEEPASGQGWIVADPAIGAWAGREGRIAVRTDGGWRFVTPPAGMLAWSKEDGLWYHFDGLQWLGGRIPASALVIGGVQVVGSRQPAVPSPSDGTTIDHEARAAVNAIIATLMSHGLIE